MKDYLVRFKKVECRAEMGVRVGGLPGDIPGVLGTSVVHYKLIRNRVCGAVRETVCVCQQGKNMRESTRVTTCCFTVCVLESWVCVFMSVWRGEKMLCLSQEQKAGSPRTLSMEIMAWTSPASRCWQLNTDPWSDIHPKSPRALCTTPGICCVKNMIWYLQKNICKWRRLPVRNGPSRAAASYLTIFGRRVGAGKQQGQMSGNAWFSLLSQPVSQRVWFTASNQSARHKRTSPSLTEAETKPWRTLRWKHAVLFRFRRWGRSGGCEAVKFPVKNVTLLGGFSNKHFQKMNWYFD